MKIFVSGPYSGETPEEISDNVHRAIHIGMKLMALGHTVLVPHLYHFLDQQAKATGIYFSYEKYMAMCFDWIEQSDAVFYLGRSPGADREVRHAQQHGKKVFSLLDNVPLQLVPLEQL